MQKKRTQEHSNSQREREREAESVRVCICCDQTLNGHTLPVRSPAKVTVACVVESVSVSVAQTVLEPSAVAHRHL